MLRRTRINVVGPVGGLIVVHQGGQLGEQDIALPQRIETAGLPALQKGQHVRFTGFLPAGPDACRQNPERRQVKQIKQFVHLLLVIVGIIK